MKITKEEFINLIKDYKEQTKRVDELEKIRFHIADSDIIEYGWMLFDKVISLIFNEDGADWVYWWIYEKSVNPSLSAYENDKELKLDTIEDLWELIKEYRK